MVIKKIPFQSCSCVSFSMKRDRSSLNVMSQPKHWFTLPVNVNNSQIIGALNTFRAGDSGLGNRRLNEHGLISKSCPLCLRSGVTIKLDEEHVIMRCQAISFERKSLRVS